MRALLLFFSLQAFTSDFRFGLGAVALYQNNIRLGQNISRLKDDHNIIGFPAIQLNYKKLSLAGPRLSLDIFSNGPIALSALISPQGHEYRSDQVAHRRDSFFASFQGRAYFFNYSIAQDINSRSNGQIIQLGVGKRFDWNTKFSQGFKFQYEYLDDKYNDYYFSVLPNESSAILNQYTPGSSWNKLISVASFITLTKKWSLNIFFNFRDLADEVNDSPTVRKGEELRAFMLVNYQVR